MKMTENANQFLVTKEYKRFKEFCEACLQYKYIGLCYGSPGVGKTLSAMYYSEWHLIEEYSRLDYRQCQPTKQVPHELIEHSTIFYTAEVANSPSRIIGSLSQHINKIKQVRYDAKFCQLAKNKEYQEKEYNDMRIQDYIDQLSDTFIKLLIVDESDRLKLLSLEQIRDFYDQKDCGLILIGMPGMEKKLSRYAQLYSRIGFVHEFKPLSQEEMLFIMSNYLAKLDINIDPQDFTDHETITAIVQATRGNFRLLNRLLKQIERIMKINMMKSVTKEVVFSARECLVIGV
ncbi:Bacteriophage DNA transposition ATPase domain protein (plasmid) [Candidatus Trichorickettsia mobilis]|nr:Bacteriophage DNA transposition ATPase domain protein [Candidatus Trichorickettsia mobilis]